MEGFLGITSGAASAVNLGVLPAVYALTSGLYLVGGVLFGVATLRAGVLPRWAGGALAVGTVAPLALSLLLPHEFIRLAAVPVGIALALLGYALWSDRRAPAAPRVMAARLRMRGAGRRRRPPRPDRRRERGGTMTADRARPLRLPPRWFVRTAWVLHRALYALTGGRFGLWRPQAGGRFGTLRLTTRGRRSGRPRVAILGYYEDGPDLVTLAMNGWAAARAGVVAEPPRASRRDGRPGRRPARRARPRRGGSGPRAAVGPVPRLPRLGRRPRRARRAARDGDGGGRARAAPRRPCRRGHGGAMTARGIPSRRGEWGIPVALIALCAIPLVAGAVRLGTLAAGAAVTPENERFFAAPLPVVLHVVAAAVYTVLGAFQFVPGFRRRRPGWHRRVGRLLVGAGLVAALSGLWMAQFYRLPAHDGALVYGFRLLFGSLMALSHRPRPRRDPASRASPGTAPGCCAATPSAWAPARRC